MLETSSSNYRGLREVCEDTSPDALMFSTFGRVGERVKLYRRQARNFLKWRIYPIADKLSIPRKLVTFQAMRRTLGTDTQHQRFRQVSGRQSTRGHRRSAKGSEGRSKFLQCSVVGRKNFIGNLTNTESAG